MLMTRKRDALGHALLSSMPDCESPFLFVLQHFPWHVTENTGLSLLFEPPFLTFNLWHLYLRENVLTFTFVCLCTVGRRGTQVFFAVVASSLLAFSFPFSPLLPQLYIVSKVASLESHTNFHGAAWEYSAACTEWKALSLTSLMCVRKGTPLQGGMYKRLML